MNILDVNLVAVVVAAVLSMFFGWFWYSPRGFGDAWLKAHNFDPENLKGTPLRYLGGFCINFVIAYVFAGLLLYIHETTILGSLRLAFWLWLGFIASTHFSGVLWAKKNLSAFTIDTGFFLISMLIMGLVFGILT